MPQDMDTITLTSERRHGNNEASYYVTERAELMRRGVLYAFRIYVDGCDDGMYSPAGHFIGGASGAWTPVAFSDMSSAEQALVDEWVADGWTLEISSEISHA